MGLIRSQIHLNNLAMIVTSLSVCSSSITELWSLDTLGIRDPIEVKTKEENEQETLQHFTQTVKRNSEGRYSVSLPWVDEGMTIPTNKAVAFKRLESTTRKLISMEKLEEYGAIFKTITDYLQGGGQRRQGGWEISLPPSPCCAEASLLSFHVSIYVASTSQMRESYTFKKYQQLKNKS